MTLSPIGVVQLKDTSVSLTEKVSGLPDDSQVVLTVKTLELALSLDEVQRLKLLLGKAEVLLIHRQHQAQLSQNFCLDF